MIVEQAYAKLNLTLEVVRKREDGYHDLASILQTVDLHDTLEFRESDGIEFECSDGSLSGYDNLVVRAAEVLRRVAGTKRGARISLEKRIPVAAGLGGGSADAAAALRGLNRLWELGMSEGELVEAAVDVGSDVPFLVSGGTSLARGRGDILERLPAPEHGWFVIVSPMGGIEGDDDGAGVNKTARMFGMLTTAAHTTGSLTRKLAARMIEKGDCHPAFMFNVFQQVAAHAFPGWQDVYDGFAGLGASDIVLTGAGPSMFAVAPSKEVATAWALLTKARMGCEAFAVGLASRIEIDPEQ